MNGLILFTGISSGFTHSIYSALSKSLLNHRIKEPFLLFLYINLFQALLTPVLWLFIQPALPPMEAWLPIIKAGTTCVIAFLFLYMALASGDASSVMPIMGSKVIFAGFLAVPLINETHGWPTYLAAVFVAISIAMLSYSPSTLRANKFSLKPILLIIGCSIVFAFTDIYLKRSLEYLDSFNLMVYYNFCVGIGSLFIIPYLMKKKVRLILPGQDLWLSLVSSIFLIAAGLLFIITINNAHGVLIPNILMSTRGVFIVLISAVLAHRGSAALETQSNQVYLLRFVASMMIIVSIWIALHS